MHVGSVVAEASEASVVAEASAKFRAFCLLTEASVLTESSKILMIRILPKLRQKVLPNRASVDLCASYTSG